MSRRVVALLTVGLVLGSLVSVSGVAVAAGGSSLQIEDAVAFTDVDGQFGSPNHVLVEVRYDAAVNNSSLRPSEVSVTTRGGTESPDAILGGAQSNDSQLLLDMGPRSQTMTASLIEAISVADSATINGTDGTAYSGAGIENASVTATTTTVTEGSSTTNPTAFRGETVAVVGDQANEGLYIRSQVGNDVVKLMTVPDDGQVYALNTSGLSFTRYAISFDGRTSFDATTGDRALELWNFTMDLRVDANPNVDDATVTTAENVTGTVTTNAAEQPLAIVVRDGEETIRSTQTVTNGSGDATFDFAPIELDDADDHFTVVATHPTTGQIAVERIKVSQIDHDAGFATDSMRENRGDVVDIPVELSPSAGDEVAVDQATVTIGGPDVGYRATVTVSDWNDDQEVVLHWNTYLADGSGGATEFWVEPTEPDERDDTITVEDVSTDVEGGPTDVLDAGLYEVSVRAGADAADRSANATTGILLTERSTTAVRAFTAPDDGDIDLETLEDLQAAMRDGSLTRTRTVASGDRSVFAIDASGIEGAIETGPETNETDAFADFIGSGASLTTVQTNTGPNRADLVVDLADPSSTHVVADGENDTYYLVVDMDEVPVARDQDGDGNVSSGDPATTLTDGDRFETTFEIPETDGGLADEEQTASVTWTFEKADATVDTRRVAGEDVVLVEPRMDQPIAGTTTVAPGTTLTLRVRDDSPNVTYLATADVTVTTNGTWAHGFDFARLPNGTALSVTVRRGGTTLATADGLVRERRSETAPAEAGTTAAKREGDATTAAGSVPADSANGDAQLTAEGGGTGADVESEVSTATTSGVPAGPSDDPSATGGPLSDAPVEVGALAGLALLLGALVAFRAAQ
ncbi:MAG: BGTF surface domain-containing protein [Halanaeroarchaeum sp.]